MKKTILLSLIALGLLNTTKAMTPIVIMFGAVSDGHSCRDGFGVCISMLTVESPNSGTFTISNKEKLETQLTVSPKTSNIGNYIKDGNFILPVESIINLDVTKKEGLSGKFAIKSGTYKATILKDGSYSINLILNALK
jgi:hypothetical protein